MNQADTHQKANLDSFIKSKMPALGIDLGGTKLAAGLVLDGQVVGTIKQIKTPQGPDNIVEALVTLISEFQKDELLAGVGIATAGIVNVDNGQIAGSTGNLPGWEGTPLKQIIEGRTMLPVHVENDANAAAYGECLAAGLQNKTCTVTVTLGTGIGVGIIINGKLYRGAHWAAGEGGHIGISLDNERLCTCGLWNCWEAYGSGRGLVTTAQHLVNSVAPGQSELSASVKQLTSQAIVDAAARQDIIAVRAMRAWHDHLCAGLVSLAHILDPDCFLLTGGMSQFVDYKLLKELLLDHTLPRIGQQVDILPSTLATAAGMVGAAQLVLEAITRR